MLFKFSSYLDQENSPVISSPYPRIASCHHPIALNHRLVIAFRHPSTPKINELYCQGRRESEDFKSVKTRVIFFLVIEWRIRQHNFKYVDLVMARTSKIRICYSYAIKYHKCFTTGNPTLLILWINAIYVDLDTIWSQIPVSLAEEPVGQDF